MNNFFKCLDICHGPFLGPGDSNLFVQMKTLVTQHKLPHPRGHMFKKVYAAKKLLNLLLVNNYSKMH